MIPTRLFVDWTVLDPVVHTFASELSQHMGYSAATAFTEALRLIASKRVNSCTAFPRTALGCSEGNHSEDFASTVNQACLQLIHMEAQGTVENAESFAIKTCSTLKMTPNKHLKCCSFIKLVDFDFRQGQTRENQPSELDKHFSRLRGRSIQPVTKLRIT